MTQYVVDQDRHYAPCSYLLCEVDTDGNWNTRDDEHTTLYDSDWDWPGLAGMLGYVPCTCGFTDGTVDCEHKTASQMIEEARDYLDDHLGEVFEYEL